MGRVDDRVGMVVICACRVDVKIDVGCVNQMVKDTVQLDIGHW